MKVRLFSGRLARTLGLCALVCSVAVNGWSCKSDTAAGGEAVKLRGSGATFPQPIYTQWFKDYKAKHSNITVEYSGGGSGTGIKEFTQGLTDFGASDAAMTDEEISKVEGGVVMLPMTAGSVVVAFNLPGVSELKLSRDAYPRIFAGRITKWNDPAIASANPDVTLPDMPITVCHRADSSGTTFVFTKHLAAVWPEFEQLVGAGKSVKWPQGQQGGDGNPGVAALMQKTPGAIGYLEYGYVKMSKLSSAALENKAGKFVKASPESGAAALASIDMPTNLRAFDHDPKGDQAFPIVSYTWLLCRPVYKEAPKAKALKEVITYCLTEGQKIADQAGYIPLPAPVVEKVKAAADGINAGA